jgi:hypothetical protein
VAKKASRKQRKQQKARVARAEEHGLPSRRPEPVAETRQRAIEEAAGRVAGGGDDEGTEDASDAVEGGARTPRGNSLVERWQRLPLPVKWGIPAAVAAGLGWLVLRPPNAPELAPPAPSAMAAAPPPAASAPALAMSLTAPGTSAAPADAAPTLSAAPSASAPGRRGPP